MKSAFILTAFISLFTISYMYYKHLERTEPETIESSTPEWVDEQMDTWNNMYYVTIDWKDDNHIKINDSIIISIDDFEVIETWFEIMEPTAPFTITVEIEGEYSFTYGIKVQGGDILKLTSWYIDDNLYSKEQGYDFYTAIGHKTWEYLHLKKALNVVARE